MSSPGTHILLFPYPAKGHIIPLLDLAQQLLTRGLTVTILVTPPNLPLLRPLLSASSLQALILSPPPPNPNLPSPIANTIALSKLYDQIKQWFQSHASPPVAIVSDMFLGWTNSLAKDLGVPRVVFWSSGAFCVASVSFLWRELPKPDDPEDEKSITSLTNVPGCPKYPWWQISQMYRDFKQGDPNWEFFRECTLANFESWGVIFNSFADLEGVYLTHLKTEMGHDRVWAVGPLGPLLPSSDGNISLTNRGGPSSAQTVDLMNWLDSKGNDQVVYICFGSRWTLTDKQVVTLSNALEMSGVHFIWVLKNEDFKYLANSFEDGVKGRGVLIKGWAPQVEILRHRAVGAFVSHCGWNSVLEGLSAEVLLLTWPICADQFGNAKLLVDEFGIAVRLCDYGDRDVPEMTELSRLLTASVDNSLLEVKNKVKEMRVAAYEALDGGSSTRDMNRFIQQLRELGN